MPALRADCLRFLSIGIGVHRSGWGEVKLRDMCDCRLLFVYLIDSAIGDITTTGGLVLIRCSVMPV